MDIISFNEAATANGRIEKFIKDPDSNSGIVTVPKVIGAGESVTVPAGRVAVLPNVQVDGTLNVEGEVFIPAGTTLSKVVELEGDQTISDVKTFLESPIVPTPTTGTQVANKDYADGKISKTEIAYNVDTSSFIPNTLASGAIIERGSNANGEYVKFADGTLIMKSVIITTTTDTAIGGIFTKLTKPTWTFPRTAYIPIGQDSTEALTITVSTRNVGWATANANPTSTSVLLDVFSAVNARNNTHVAVAIGRWK